VPHSSKNSKIIKLNLNEIFRCDPSKVEVDT
jgi:hypothetical protein